MQSSFEHGVSVAYYTGVGATLIGTFLSLIYRFFRSQHDETVFLNELKQVHLPNMYDALDQIAERLDIRLKLKRPGDKPLGE